MAPGYRCSMPARWMRFWATMNAAYRAGLRRLFVRFGKGRHRAALNYGDCFAYALATVVGEPLLCKGDDFGHTDVALAVAGPSCGG